MGTYHGYDVGRTKPVESMCGRIACVYRVVSACLVVVSCAMGKGKKERGREGEEAGTICCLRWQPSK